MGFVMPDDEKDLVVSLLDLDCSGTIDADEFRAWFTVNKDKFFSGGYSDDVKSAIYYFKTYDKDLSGELDRPEFEAMCEGMGWGSDAVTETLAIIDRDGNGTVSLQEFLAWYTDDGMVTQLLQLYDADKSGRPMQTPSAHRIVHQQLNLAGGLNLKEFGDLCKRWKLKGKQVKNLFQKYDQDGNGELGTKDLKKMLERVQSKKASSRGAELPLRPAPSRTLVCVNQARSAPCCADLIAKGDTLCRGWLMVSEGKPPKKVGGQVQYGRAKKQFVTLVIDRGNSYTTSDHVEHEQLNFYNKAPQMSHHNSCGASSPDLYYRGDEVQASVQVLLLHRAGSRFQRVSTMLPYCCC
jgi:Ca2+-binding EF-hand superfamily protein